MAKELPETNAPRGVFHLFNEKRTFYFESDISSLPHPPVSLPGPVPRAVQPKLRKSLSQPQLHLTASSSTHSSSIALTTPNTTTATSTSSASKGDNLHLPAAIMATTTFQAPSGLQSCSRGDEGHLEALGSLQSRYHTEPAYTSTSILRSFKHEFNFFGHNRNKHGSHSAPVSPRRSSSPELIVPAHLIEASSHHHQQHDDQSASDMRKLSLVREESDRDLKMDSGTVGVGGTGGQVVAQQGAQSSSANKSGLLKSAPTSKDIVDGQMPRAGETKSLTRQVMTWFITPQTTAPTSVKTAKAEFNAMAPSSF